MPLTNKYCIWCMQRLIIYTHFLCVCVCLTLSRCAWRKTVVLLCNTCSHIVSLLAQMLKHNACGNVVKLTCFVCLFFIYTLFLTSVRDCHNASRRFVSSRDPVVSVSCPYWSEINNQSTKAIQVESRFNTNLTVLYKRCNVLVGFVGYGDHVPGS